jgi:hypothetical protein
MEKEHEVKEGKLIFEKVSGLSEVQEKVKDFKPNDIIALDWDETSVRSIENYLFGNSFHVLDEEVESFLKNCEEKEIPLALITNRPRENHPLEGRIHVVGYEYYTDKKLFKTLEYLVNMVVSGGYKATPACYYEAANWAVNGRDLDLGKIAWVGNSLFDKSFAERFDRVLREVFDYKDNLYMYKVPTLKSFSKR